MTQSDSFRAVIRKDAESSAPLAPAEKRVKIDVATRHAVTGWSSYLANTESYVVANSTDPMRVAADAAPTLNVLDFASRRNINLVVKYEARCPRGNEERVAEALSGSQPPSVIFHGLLHKWVLEYVGSRPADFILQFFNNKPHLEEHLRQRALREAGLVLQAGVSLADEGLINRTAVVKLEKLPVRLKDCKQEHLLTLEVGLPVDDAHRIEAHVYRFSDEQLQQTVKERMTNYFFGYVSLNDFPSELNKGPFRVALVDHLNAALRVVGRRVSHLLVEGEATPSQEFYEARPDISYEIQGYPVPVVIKNTVQMIRRDRASYANAGSPDLDVWLLDNLDQVIKLVLFGKRYIDLLLRFDVLEREIKNKLSFRAAAIGYDVQQLITVPDLEPYKWLENFAVEGEGDFDTSLSKLTVRLSFVVTAKINHLQDVADYLNRNANVPNEMKATVIEEIRALLHTIDPERFYARFSHTNVAGEVAVAALLDANIRDALQRKFKAEISSVILKVVDDDKIVGPFENARKLIVDFVVAVSNSQEIGQVNILGDFQVEAIGEWGKYRVMNLDPNDMRKQVEKNLQAELANVPLWALSSREPTRARAVKERVEELVKAHVMRKYGLAVDVGNLRTEVDGAPTWEREQWETLYREGLEADAETKKQLTARLNQLRQQIGDGIAAGVKTDDIKRRVAELEEYLSSLAAPSWRGNRQLEDELPSDSPGLPGHNGAAGAARDEPQPDAPEQP